MRPQDELKDIWADRTPLQIAIELSGFTGHRTTLISELTDDEARQLIAIYSPSGEELNRRYKALENEFLSKEWKSRVLSKAEKIGIKKPNSFKEFNSWMLNKSRFKKQLTSHTVDELRLLHQQLCAFESNNKKSAGNHFSAAWWEKNNHNKNLN